MGYANDYTRMRFKIVIPVVEHDALICPLLSCIAELFVFWLHPVWPQAVVSFRLHGHCHYFQSMSYSHLKNLSVHQELYGANRVLLWDVFMFPFIHMYFTWQVWIEKSTCGPEDIDLIVQAVIGICFNFNSLVSEFYLWILHIILIY